LISVGTKLLDGVLGGDATALDEGVVVGTVDGTSKELTETF